MDRDRTSPYKFYQYWINSSDEDSAKYIRIFTLKTKEEIEEIEAKHNLEPHLRLLQKELAKDITTRVHSEEDYKSAIDASEILFKKGDEAVEALKGMNEAIFMDVFEGVPQAEVSKSELEAGISIIDSSL